MWQTYLNIEVSYLHIHLYSKIFHRRRRVRPRRPIYLLIVGSDYCVMCFPYALHIRRQHLVLVSCLYTEPFELVLKSSSATRLPATKLFCSNVHSGAAALSASMMLLCFSLASSSFTLKKSAILSDNRLYSRMYHVR